jgi:hypothetical protein
LFCAILTAASLPADVIGMAGKGYGAAEIKAIAQNVLDRDLSSLTYEMGGDFLPAEDFQKYKMVVLAGDNDEQSYSAEDIEKIQAYVENGGRLLLIHQAPKMFSMQRGTRAEVFAFGRSYYMREIPESSVREPGSPLLAGAFDSIPQPFWLRGNILLKSPDWDNLVGTDEFILVGHRPLGKGHLYYAGSELFRILKAAKDSQEPDAALGWIQILKNIFTHATVAK